MSSERSDSLNEKDQHLKDGNAHQATVRAGLEEVDQGLENRPPWLLTRTELKLLGIAGVGFFLDGANFFDCNLGVGFHPSVPPINARVDLAKPREAQDDGLTSEVGNQEVGPLLVIAYR